MSNSTYSNAQIYTDSNDGVNPPTTPRGRTADDADPRMFSTPIGQGIRGRSIFELDQERLEKSQAATRVRQQASHNNVSFFSSLQNYEINANPQPNTMEAEQLVEISMVAPAA